MSQKSSVDSAFRSLTFVRQHYLDSTTKEHPSFASVAPYLHGVEKQSEHIAAETVRLQGFMRSLVPQSLDTGHVVIAL
jgi:hypothetical protein